MNARLLLTALTCSVLLAACGQEAPAPAPENPNARPVDAATAGMITGSVTFTGTPPPTETISMGTDQACVDAAGETAMSDAVLISDNGSLQNDFVYIQDGLDPDYRFETPTEEVVLDQDGCKYTPRVLGVRVGQTLKVLNSDPTMHNVHALPMENIEFNKSTPMEGTSTTNIFTVPEVMVRFMCNVHAWMQAYVGVTSHPYFAVTGADGSFSLEGVPPGTYTIEAWHEKFGTQTATVTIGASETGTTSFEFTNTAGS
jgi:plastocyanin